MFRSTYSMPYQEGHMSPANDFAAVLGFTEDDLILNREGRLSEVQILARKKIARSSAMGCMGIVGFVFVFSAFMLFTTGKVTSVGAKGLEQLSDPSIWIPGILCLLSGSVALLALASAYFPKTPTLGRLTGTVVRGNITPNKRVYEVEINGRGFKVPQVAYELIDPAKMYTIYTADIQYGRLTIYSTDDNNHILAIEEATSSEAAEAKSPIDYAQAQFRRLFQFSDSDLETNRAGQLSPEQAARLNNNTSNGVGQGVFLGTVFALLPFTFIGVLTQNLLWIAAGAGFFLLLLFLSVLGERGARRKLAKALRSGAAKADGSARAWVTQVKHHRTRHSWTETVYHIQVGEIKFKVKEDVYYAFKEGSAYRVYYVKRLQNKIISAEQVG
jgi:hypothetical protein